jgi:hypothetical protein
MTKGNVVSKEAVAMEGKGAGLYGDKSTLMKGSTRKGGAMGGVMSAA